MVKQNGIGDHHDQILSTAVVCSMTIWRAMAKREDLPPPSSYCVS